MGYTLVLIQTALPTLKARAARRLTRRDELAAPDRVRQWLKSGGVIFLTLAITEAVADAIYDHSFTGVKIGGGLYNHIMGKQVHIGHNIGPDEANKKLNIGMAMYGAADPAFRDEQGQKEDPSEGYTSQYFGDGWEQMPAPSTGKRRRALWIGYHRGMKILVVIFTTKTSTNAKRTGKTAGVRNVYGTVQPWWKYEDVDLEMWEELVGYHSTGEWLKFSGVEQGSYSATHAAELDELTKEYKLSLNQ